MLDNEKMNFIGDCCFRFNKFRYINDYFQCSEIILNYTNDSNKILYETLLTNNPYIRLENKNWDSINFEDYDIVFVIAHSEDQLLEYLCLRYQDDIMSNKFCAKIYSISSVTLKKEEYSNFVFPEYPKILDVVKNLGPGEIYLETDEIDQGEGWFLEQGVKEGDKVFVMVDSSSARSKLMNLVEYFELLKSLLQLPDVKLLIFDENKIGKKAFYKEWLGEDLISRLIVSEGKSLRFNISLLGSSFITMIFGPCTGIMHCSSSVYNHFFNKGMSIEMMPLMIVYTGIYEAPEMGVDFWWGSSPLIKCLLLKTQNNQNMLLQLSQLSGNMSNNENNALPCSEYNSNQLFGFINRELLFNKRYLS
ncbi:MULTISPECIES: hypothetical protein [Sphingobacterium]|nr:MULTISPECIES: hypothetical protein [Sphingobacterium]